MTEQQIQSKIIKFLEKNGAFVIKTITSNKAGIPDIISCRNGYFISIEVKTDIGKVSWLQEQKLNRIQKAGGIAEIVKPSNFVEKMTKIMSKTDKVV